MLRKMILQGLAAALLIAAGAAAYATVTTGDLPRLSHDHDDD
ncbi:MAG: hypothetical protein AB1918_17075 [Pseudomonadota bacterium]